LFGKVNQLFLLGQGLFRITSSEESSGIIPLAKIIDSPAYLTTVQSHISFDNPWKDIFNRWRFKLSRQEGQELVTDGQLCIIEITP